MAIIPGVTVNWRLSPRVITIPSTETEITIVDLQDTLLDLEDDVEGILHPDLRATSGGEDLGGGVFVGWTMELQNAVIAPQIRSDSQSIGTATSADSNGVMLTDTGATFISDGVTAGASLINVTDGSVTSVIEVISETELLHYQLADGTDNDWDISDSYKVWNEVQFNITGGNLVAVDGVGASVSPIRSTFGNEILKTSSSSATFNEQETIQYSSFGGGVTLDTVNGTAGTTYPIGTEETPVDNLTDALLIANSRGFGTIYLKESITISTEDASDGFKFIGSSETDTVITIDAGADVTNCLFESATILGTLDGNNTLRRCIISTLSYANGILENCLLNAGVITLGGATTAYLIDCHSGVPGSGTPTIDMGGSGQPLAIRDYNGGIELINKSGPEAVSIDLNSGQVKLDSTITNGEIVVRGIGKLTDNSVGANVNDDDLLNRENISKASREAVFIDSTGTSGTAFPLGTASNPVDNLTDAKTIADDLGLKVLSIAGNFSLNDDFSGWTLKSQSSSVSTITLNNQLTTNSLFQNLKIAGQQNTASFATFENCTISTGVTNIQGVFDNCTVIGSQTLPTGASKQVTFINCSAGGSTGATINSQSGSIVAGTNLSGNWTLTGVVAGAPPSVSQLEFDSGSITLDASNTGGVITIAGVVALTDNSAGATVVRDGHVQESSVVDATWNEQKEDHVTDGSIGDHIRRIKNNKV